MSFRCHHSGNPAVLRRVASCSQCRGSLKLWKKPLREWPFVTEYSGRRAMSRSASDRLSSDSRRYARARSEALLLRAHRGELMATNKCAAIVPPQAVETGSASGAVVFSQFFSRLRCSSSRVCSPTAPGCRWRR